MPDPTLVLEKLRAAHMAAINLQPVSIAIHRIEQVDDGAGGVIIIETDLPPFTGRLKPSGRVSEERTTTAGTMRLYGWTLLAPHDADIRQSATVTDRFTVNGKTYQVVRVRQLSYAGQPFGVEADCIEAQ